MIIPTIGRVVLFYPNGFPGDGEQALAASIAYVHSDRLINIGYLTPNGEHRAATSVHLQQEGDQLTDMISSSPYCEWMPFQKGQAAKTEAVEKELAAKDSP